MDDRNDAGGPSPHGERAGSAWMRVTGGVLLLLGTAPLPLLLVADRTGPAGAATRAALEGVGAGIGVPLVCIGVLSLLAGALPSARPHLAATVGLWTRTIGRPGARLWIVGVALLAGAGAAATDALLLRGEPTLVDEMVQLAEAREVAGRMPSAELPPAAVRLQNGAIVDGRWVSVYPPGHTFVLAGAIRVGAVRWGGVLLWALAVGLSTALWMRLLGAGSTVARGAGLLAALAPMGWFFGAGYLSHVGAACAVACVLYASTRADAATNASRAVGWGVVAGAAAGWAVTTRPLTGLALAIVVPAIRWFGGRREPSLPVLAGAVAGGLPFAVGLAAWNARRFGAPATFGYDAAFGPAHGLGFHTDPWGNVYGAIEAVGYTAADLFLVGPSMFGLPLPLAGVIGAALLLGRLPAAPAVRLATGWIAAAVVANALYWHHGLHFGPRMLFETLPAWALLASATAAAAGRAVLAPTAPDRGTRALRDRVRVSFAAAPWATVAVALLLHLPGLLANAAVGEARRAQLPEPEAVAALPDSAMIVVHGSWSSRIAARLAGTGMRADSIETALRRNGLCRVHGWLEARESGTEPPLPLDFAPRPGVPSSLRPVELAPGNTVRLSPGEAPTPACLREMRADRFGGVELEALRWRTVRSDLLWLRDLGPEWNPDAAPDGRTAWLLVPDEVGGRPRFVPLDEGERRVWGEPADEAGASVSGSGPGL